MYCMHVHDGRRESRSQEKDLTIYLDLLLLTVHVCEGEITGTCGWRCLAIHEYSLIHAIPPCPILFALSLYATITIKTVDVHF